MTEQIWENLDGWPAYVKLNISANRKKNNIDQKLKFPRVWVTYNKNHDSLEKDFQDLTEHGVAGITVNPEDEKKSVFLQLARKYGIKMQISIPEVTENMGIVKKHGLKPAPAIMLGGAYQGKAIDRNLFQLEPGVHTLEIEEPIYDKEKCYGDCGHYFPDLGLPLKAEIVIPQKNYDGRQHLTIKKADIQSSQKENYYKISFNLSRKDGDLSRIGIALYWHYEGTDQYWIFGEGNVTSWAESTRRALELEVKEKVEKWKTANGGEFPRDEVVSARFGDECFYITSHLNAEEVSYPLWDYSQEAISEFKKLRPEDEYPRTWGFPEIYGPDAYGDWMYILHKGTAELCKLVSNAFQKYETKVQVLRNITRNGVFALPNYHDGTGLQMLVQNLDIVHLDPYPCFGENNYRERTIPRDMAYVCGLARRFNKPVLPWMQSHSYWAGRGGLDHPEPGQIKKMMEQQMEFNPMSIMWLAYPGTFGEKPVTWEIAKKMHKKYVKLNNEPVKVPVAVVRFYNVWSLVTASGDSMDKFLTDEVIEWIQFEKGLTYDSLEVRNALNLDQNELNKYDIIITYLPPAGKEALIKFKRTGQNTIIFYDNKKWLEQAASEAGIKDVYSFENNSMKSIQLESAPEISLRVINYVNCKEECKILGTTDDKTVIWKYHNLIFVGISPESKISNISEWLLNDVL
ncbi:MAG: hypothetical protein ACOCP5_02410 [Halanaerobiaceae bacterium]